MYAYDRLSILWHYAPNGSRPHMITLQELIDSGVHFGHRVSRWNPKMKPYIHGRRSLIHIINLRETVRGLIRATNFLKHVASEGQLVLYVGTKRQAKTIIFTEAERSGMPFVNERWLGGTLTNYSTIRERLARLQHLEDIEADGRINLYAKKEVSQLMREKRKIQRNLQGIRNMNRLPGALIVVDNRREHIAVQEAKKLGIPTVCILDTDCDPDLADIPIPGNDDAFRSINVLVSRLTNAVIEGKKAHDEHVKIEAKRKAEKSQIHEKEKRDREEAYRKVKKTEETADKVKDDAEKSVQAKTEENKTDGVNAAPAAKPEQVESNNNG